MSAAAPGSGAPAWDDACLAVQILAVDPAGIGGVALRSRVGPVRERWLDAVRAALPAGHPVARIPPSTGDDRLLGGLDLAATLAAGRPVAERGILAAADGGIVILPMAERCPAGVAARIAASLDTGAVSAERDGLALRHPARIGAIALDEGIEPDERPPQSLLDRLAIHLDLGTVAPGEAFPPPPADVVAARSRLAGVAAPDALVEAMCGAALAFGIASLRAPILAVRVARASAALAGRAEIGPDDAALAARLVLAPRATRVPAGESEPEQRADDTEPDAPPPEPREDEAEPGESESVPPLEDVIQAAVAASIPPDLLAALRLGTAGRGRSAGASGAGAQQRDRKRGRPAGTTRGEPRRGARLDLVATLRAAAPWQRLRRGGHSSPESGIAVGTFPSPLRGGPSGREASDRGGGRPEGTTGAFFGTTPTSARPAQVGCSRLAPSETDLGNSRGPGDPVLPARGRTDARLRLGSVGQVAREGKEERPAVPRERLAIRKDDLRITRFKRRTESTTIFVVDASGSSAFHRLAEAKGAVELLLAECYIRRDRVALMAFRGTVADLVLPPTRSLARAKRGLAALPGGGGTPLATAIDAAGLLVSSVTRAGGSAVAVFMTDGRANISRDGAPGREKAAADARDAARAWRASGAAGLLIDISPRPNEAAAGIAREMGAGYLPLPAADAAALTRLVQREVAAVSGRAAR